MKMSKLTNVMIGLSIGAIMALPSVAAEVTITNPNVGVNTDSELDYANAIPMDSVVGSYVAPENGAVVSNTNSEVVVVEGSVGTGELNSEKLGKVELPAAVAPSEYGTGNVSYNTTRVDMYHQRLSRKYPNRVTGKLFFKIGEATYVCSAASIKPGVIVTAAHCMYDNSADTFYSGWEFVPAYYAGEDTGGVIKAPYGKYGWKGGRINTGYITATTVVNEFDVGFLAMKKRPNPFTGTDMYPGERTGRYGYAYGGSNPYGFVNGSGQITQMGYPVSHDNGQTMQRNDSLGTTYVDSANNTVIGSRMTGGSSGGPWIANYGQTASLSGTAVGTSALRNLVVGVASWGYTSDDPKIQGASLFSFDNFGTPLSAMCDDYPDNCGL